MFVNSDFSDLLNLFNVKNVRYLVIGGYALIQYAEPRYTKDLDIWIEATPKNAQKMLKALDLFGFASLGLKEADFLVDDQIIQLGYPPNRIDLLSSLPGVEFTTCYEQRVQVQMDDIRVNFIDLANLRKNKQASGRLQDLADLENLK